MKRFLQSSISWWFATMVPIHVSATTLTERENLRKRKLLSLILGIACLSATAYVVLGFALTSFQVLITILDIGILLYALWLNRQGYLKTASVLFFFIDSCATFIGVHSISLIDPFIILWACFFMTIFLTLLGLFVSPQILMLLAVIENLLMFWYLLVVCHVQIGHLLSPVELVSFLVYLAMLIYVSAFVGVFYAVTTKKAVVQADRAVDLEEAYAIIQKQALTDGLTGLPNHRAVMDQLQKELECAQHAGCPFSVLFFDADRFKHVNDTYGHAVGDAALRQIGERTAASLREGDTLGRFGGEEFVVLLPEADTAKAMLIAERIRACVASHPINAFEVPEGVAMTVSIGIATYPSDGTSEQNLLSQADEAMYVAKRLGRNQVRTAEDARTISADVELMAMLVQEGQREAEAREVPKPEQFRETYTMRIICSLLALLERRDEGLSSHAHAVSDLATTIAQAMGMEHKEVVRIGMAALLHDIGKIALPDLLLQKAALFSSREHAPLEEHIKLGAEILEANPFLRDLQLAVRHHHERWDGCGYPDQLQGEDIPLAARIIAVAEAYDTMLRDYSYQACCSAEETLREVQRCAGIQFDPVVVQVLSGLFTQMPQQKTSIQLVG